MTKLRQYRSKRRFTQTPEPFGAEAVSDPEALCFVLQHHAAKRVHFDLRLELDGVLKSWAVPEGPSTEPAERRLAIATEDHPLDYAEFEGEIPDGQYGAGVLRTVDQGAWVPLGDPGADLEKGELKFRLSGRQLSGGWMLKKLPGDKADWLLIKERDQGVGAEIKLPQGKPAKAPALPGKPGPLPKKLKPQLPTSAEVAPEGDAWVHEIKYDGYRTIVRIEDGQVRMFTRQGLDWTERYQALVPHFQDLDCSAAMIDGEVVAQDARGATSLDLLQETLSAGHDHELVFYAFDLIHLDGQDLSSEPLLTRKALLRRLIPDEETTRVQYSDHLETEGRDLFAQICRMGLEGIVSKSKTARYQETRTKTWLKVKRFDIGTFTVIGFTTKASASHAASLILAEDVDGLSYVGRAGSGLSNEIARDLYNDLSTRTIPKPVVEVPKIDNPHWIEPGPLTAEISFRGRSTKGVLKQPAVIGITNTAPKKTAPRRKLITDRDLANIRLTNPDREMFEGSGVTKLDVALYFARVGDAMLPDLLNRPVTLIRCSTGKIEDCFYQRHGFSGLPDGVETMGDRRDDEFLVIKDPRGFLGLPQFGVLEFHPWDCTIEDLGHPDRMTLDLDPGDGISWGVLASAAEDLRDRLATLDLSAFVRTTGGNGLHLVVPLEQSQPWDQVKVFLKGFAKATARDAPRLFTDNVQMPHRKGRIYLDVNRTGFGASAVASYSLRARDGFPVAMPVSWEALKPKATRIEFNRISAVNLVEDNGADAWIEMENYRSAISQKALRAVGVRV
ncbi:MAG: DNA ligase D [Pseudomonadota bacterium]